MPWTEVNRSDLKCTLGVDSLLHWLLFYLNYQPFSYIFSSAQPAHALSLQFFARKRYILHSLRQEPASWRLVAFENQLKLRTDKDSVWRVFIRSLLPLENPFFLFFFFENRKTEARFRGKNNEVIHRTGSGNPPSEISTGIAWGFDASAEDFGLYGSLMQSSVLLMK